jgi:deferrochelatase/peroxidase EfeB
MAGTGLRAPDMGAAATGRCHCGVRRVHDHERIWRFARDRGDTRSAGGVRRTRAARRQHIRLARPRTKPTENQRILRRGYNYTRGYDAAGQLDQGLAFVAFKQSPARQFATIQQRLADEPMVDYITPFGGGYFFAPAGATGDADWVGSKLFSV